MPAQSARQASERFYAAMNRALNGDPSAISDVASICSQGEDISVMSEMGGRQTGWAEVSAMWQAGAEAVSSGQVEMSDLQVTLLADDAAFTSGVLSASITVGAMPLNFSARCTDIYRREGGDWKLVHHHLDQLPDAEKLQSAMLQSS